MTGIDWLIVAFTAALAVYGYAQGFIVGALSLMGFAIGAFIGTRIGPVLLPSGSHSPYAPLFGLLGALLAGGVLASGFEGIGARARSLLLLPGLKAADGLLGAALTACVALAIAWIVGAFAIQSTHSPSLRQKLESSKILRGLDELLPPAGPILNALARFDPLPSVTGPAANVPPPTHGIVAARGVRAAASSVVRIQGTACGLGIEGSGWVAAPGLVVTNAHVVAGEADTQVQGAGNPGALAAEAVAFDPHDDIAVLRVPALGLRPLAMAPSAPGGTPAAILGYPLDGPFNAQPARIGATQPVQTEDAYGRGPVLRTIVSLRGLVRPGNSGGPLVNATGQVVATVFAAITGGNPTAGPGGFAIPDSTVAQQLLHAEAQRGPVSTQACGG